MRSLRVMRFLGALKPGFPADPPGNTDIQPIRVALRRGMVDPAHVLADLWQRQKHRLLIGVAMVLPAFLTPVARAEDIGDAMSWALRTDTSLKSDIWRQKATEARLRGSIEAFLPTVEYQQQTILNSHLVYSPTMPVLPNDSFARREPDQYGVQATLPLFDGFRRYNTYQAAKLAVEAGRFVTRNARQQVMLDAATAYLAVVRDRAIASYRSEQLASIQRMKTMTEKRYELRDNTMTDVALAQSRVEGARIALEAAKSDLASSETEFRRITGNAPGRFAVPRAPDSVLPRSREELRIVLIAENPQLAAARLDAKAAKYQAEAAKSELLPTVNLVGSYGQADHQTPFTPKIDDTTIKLQVRIPLYQPGAYSHIEEAKALAIQKNYDVIDGEKKTVSNAESLFDTRRSLIRQTAEASARVAAMRKAVAGYRIEQDAGYRTIVDTLNAVNELTEAQVFVAQMAYTRDKATFMLAAALGRLDDEERVAVR
jgi:outer membrane protein